MTLIYVSSMDQYGASGGSIFGTDGNTGGWLLDNPIMLGDTWTSQPEMLYRTSGADILIRPRGLLEIKEPSWGARRGDYALVASGMTVAIDKQSFYLTYATYTQPNSAAMAMAIPGATAAERMIHFAYGMDSLPNFSGNEGYMLNFLSNTGQLIARMGVDNSGRIYITDGSALTADFDQITAYPTIIAITSAPVVTPNTWYSFNIRFTITGVNTADIEIWNGDIIAANKIMDVTGVAVTNTGASNIDILGFLPASLNPSRILTDDQNERAVRDIVVYDSTGTYNNAPLGQVFCSAQEMRAEDVGGGWDAETRSNLSDGVLNHQDAVTGLRIGDNANIELGSGDFTIEGFWRINDLPTDASVVTLASKWSADNDNRSWRLYWDGDADELKFGISTDGIAETELFVYPWIPDLDKYYHVAVNRDTAVLQVFVNGVQLGVDIADANTYFNGSANFGLCSEWGSGNTLVTASTMQGFVDEFRLTVGLARYSVDFTPTAVPFGRIVGDDANIANVEILMGFDGGTIEDESSNAFTVTVGTGVTADLPDDDDNSFQVLNRRPAWDDTYIEARNTFARGILTLTGLPLNTETMTLGATTYTFVTTLSAGPTVANEILIGADVPDQLLNIIDGVNAGAGVGTLYSIGTVANLQVFASTLPSPQVQFTATDIGVTGNTRPSTETLTNGTFKAATLLGGEDIPAPSDFAMERLPVEVTGVLGMQVTARGFKSNAGSANLRFDLKGPGAAVATGDLLATDLNPAWLRQIYEEDPDTVATITPSTITGGRVRVTRTT